VLKKHDTPIFKAEVARELLKEGKTLAQLAAERLPVRAYPLLGPGAGQVVSRPPLVGRRRELAQLGLLRDAALEERHPQLVSILAPAGMGKTRLFLRDGQARQAPTWPAGASVA